MTEQWLKQPKVLPCLIVVKCQTRKVHQPPEYSPALTGAALSLVQTIILIHVCKLFLWLEHWLKQPNVLPCLIVVESQTRKMHQPPQNTTSTYIQWKDLLPRCINPIPLFKRKGRSLCGHCREYCRFVTLLHIDWRHRATQHCKECCQNCSRSEDSQSTSTYNGGA